MITIIALIIDGKYNMELEGVYFLTFMLDLAFIITNPGIFS